MQSVSEQDIPAGMVAYGPDHPDYPNAPKDWDGGDWWERGEKRMRPRIEFREPFLWGHCGDRGDIIAYTPSPAPMVEQAGDVIQADIDLADEVVSAANIVSHDGYYEVDTEAVAKVIARHRLNARPAPSETEGAGASCGVTWALEKACNLIEELIDRNDADGDEDRADDLKLLGMYRKILASTPPADAGMLREALEGALPYLVAYLEGIEAVDRKVLGRPGGNVALNGVIAKARAALNSQAHQIREGNHG